MYLSFHLNSPTDKVYDYLTEIEKFVSVHPIINKMEPTSELNTYKVFETVKFGFIPYSFSYTATVSGDKEKNQVTIVATVRKMTKIEMIFNITPTELGCQIEEEISINSPFPIKGYMNNLFSKQHQILFKNIDDAL